MSAVILATWAVRVIGLYLGFGVLFAVPFVIRGVGRIDPDAREGTWGFRLLILPGAVVLWPVLFRRLFSGVSDPPVERNEHRSRAILQ